MKFKYAYFLTSFVLFTFAWASYGCTSQDKETKEKAGEEINWVSYKEGMNRGNSENKKVFINFFATWCKYCKVMDKETFANQKIIDYINENFIPVKVDADKSREIARKYQVAGLPVVWFVESNGHPIGAQPGYVPPESLLPILKYIHTNSYKKMKYDEFVKKQM